MHGKLLEDPFTTVMTTDLLEIADKDVVHNYQAVLRFRDFLGQHPTLEATYLAFAKGVNNQIPPLFFEQMAQIILRDILNGERDPIQVRAAELLFRHQAVTLDDGRIMVADLGTVELQAGMQRLVDPRWFARGAN